MDHHQQRWTAAVATAICLTGFPASAASAGIAEPPAATNPQVNVLVVNQVKVSGETLRAAQAKIVKMFAQIDVDIVWRDDVPADDVRFLVLSITHEPVLPAAVSREALGAAASTPGARGRLSYVFYARVLEATQRYAADLETVLAMTMAHELGHMLRPTREHDSDGLMRETWTPREFALASRGALAFSKDSAAAIRLALRR
jgi:hypothetical protein